MKEPLQTVSMHEMIRQFQAGDGTALNELITRTQVQLEHLTRKMLHGFPGVHAHEQTDDVLQNALVRMTRALQEVTPQSVREYFALAAELLRRELIDLARRYSRRSTQALEEGNDAAPEATDIDQWAALQVAIEKLPVEQREVFGLTFYHGWTQPQIAELLQISDRQVRRLWTSACLELNRLVEGRLPAL